jgi:hypothetical protein
MRRFFDAMYSIYYPLQLKINSPSYSKGFEKLFGKSNKTRYDFSDFKDLIVDKFKSEKIND